ncbi:MAG: insulinase family protein [Flavobacteriia bacterium]|nr:insulinase family protein [Flavobacteriia bacterium]
MSIDRSSAPILHDISNISFKNPQITYISKFCPFIYWTDVKDQSVRLELHFNAGKNVGNKNISFFVNSLLFTGTNKKSSFQIHEELDQLGCYIQQQVTLESAYIGIYCLKNNLNAVLDIVLDSLQNAIFSESEVQDMLIQKRQSLKLSLEKVNFLASKKINELFYNQHENYARQLELEDLNSLNQEDLIDFYKEFYLNGLKKVVLVADLEESKIKEIERNILNWVQKESITYLTSLSPEKGLFHVEKENALQTSIKLVQPFHTKKHPDYFEFLFLQTVLGDYFGSRLMSNLREDKGFTYGIGSYVVEQKGFSIFGISTEVKKEVANEALVEIKKECEKLQIELIGLDELNTVKQYKLGQLLRSTDGVNNLVDSFLSVFQQDLTLSFYQQYIQAIKEMDASCLQNMAKKYLNWEDFTIVTAG